ncbi:hypothetical protein WA158_005842 [Blastocystis sp. Blastoise]
MLVNIQNNFVDLSSWKIKFRCKVSDFSLDLWPGFECTSVNFNNKWFLQINKKNKTLHHNTVLEEFQLFNKDEIMGELPFSIVTTYSHESYRIEDIDWSLTPESTFKRRVKGGEPIQISYLDYYRNGPYGISIRDKRQLLLICNYYKNGKKSCELDNRIYLIPELCVLFFINIYNNEYMLWPLQIPANHMENQSLCDVKFVPTTLANNQWIILFGGQNRDDANYAYEDFAKAEYSCRETSY